MGLLQVGHLMETDPSHARLSHEAAYAEGSAFVIDDYVALPWAAVPITDCGFLRADAVYDVVSVSRGSFFRLDAHQERFARACETIRVKNPYTREEEATILHRLVALTGLQDAYVWWAVTRGEMPHTARERVQSDLYENRFYAFVIPYFFICEDEQRERGVDVVVSQRRIRISPRAVDPRAKNFHWLDMMMSLFEAGDRETEWSVLTDADGYLTEAPGANIFAIRDGAVLTPESGCLEGVTRRSALDLCAALGVPCREARIHADELRSADEAFYTSEAGGIMPINSVDGHILGGHAGPGELTARLHDAYWQRRWSGWDATPVRYDLAQRSTGGRAQQATATTRAGTEIGLANWSAPENRRLGLRHLADFIRHEEIAPGPGPVREFGYHPRDLSRIAVPYRGEELPLECLLAATETSGFLVLAGDDVVDEAYPGMEPGERHSIQSVTKTMIPALLGEFVESGRIDLEATVATYIPEIGSGYANVRIQDVLDMRARVAFVEDYEDPDCDAFRSEMALGFRPNPEGLWPGGNRQLLVELEPDTENDLGEETNYKSPNSDVLGWAIENVSGQPLADLFGERVYRHIGAERSAALLTDPLGSAIPSAGLVLTLRDLARYGQIFASMGVSKEGRRLIPEAWLAACLDASQGTVIPDPMGRGSWRYHNHIMTNGRAFAHTGWCGQFLYADTRTGIVIAKFSALTLRSGWDLEVGTADLLLAEAIVEALSG